MIHSIRKSINILALCLLATTGISHGKVRIVAALPDLGSIAAYIGGDNVEVSSIAKANSNPHSVEVFPSYMAKVSQAALYLKCGLALDQWSDAIIDGSRNNKLSVVDCSKGIVVLEKPSHVDASMGDVHAFGNPHYWLDPRNGLVIGQNIVSGLKVVDPLNETLYESNFARFKTECENKFGEWQSAMKPLDGSKIITYHSSWTYFAEAFHLNIIEHVEPFPGIPPTGKHLAHLVELIKKENVTFILQEPYFPGDAPKFLTKQTGVKVFKFAPSCADVNPDSYVNHFDDIVKQLATVPGGK
jgi:zinc/manganese transport system substrate-binding protein